MRTYVWTGNKGEKVLSYDENFKKWQKSRERKRESKTPGGVKIGIYRFIAVLLFCCIGLTFNYSAWATQCSNYDASTNTGCDASHRVAGCYYEQSGDDVGCKACDDGKYCDGTSFSQQDCPSDFSFSLPSSSSSIGAKSKYECYKKLNGQTGNGYGSKCQNSTGTDITYSDTDNTAKCRQYYRESGTFVSCNGDTGTDDSNVNNSATSDYHIEGSGNNAKCYSNTRNCNLFTTSGTVDGVSGEANWLENTSSQTYKWNAANCIKQKEYNGNNCKGIQIEKPPINCNAANDCHSWVQNATSSITYNYYGYYCKSCNAGYEVNNSTDATCSTSLCTDSSSANTCGSNQVYICKCGAINRGYYRSTQVNLCDNNNCKRSFNAFLNLFTGNVNQPCGPGQTTNGGATSVNDCHYTERTRFCDAHGCFYLSNLSWDATNGYTWGGATSTSPGSD